MRTHTDPSPAVVWHDLECGGYEADLPLWRELAAEAAPVAARAAEHTGSARGAILDAGAGTGRVALDLAARGHAVTALECDPELAAALRERAAAQRAADPGSGAGEITVVEGDACRLALSDPTPLPVDARFALCIVAMQTLQLFGGVAGRAAFLGGVRPHLESGAVVACAIVGGLEPFDVAGGDPPAAPERARAGGREYISRAVRVAAGAEQIAIERERVVRDLRDASVLTRERDLTTIDCLDAAQLAAEAGAAGLRPLGVRSVPDTREHVGSTVVMFGA